MENEYQYSVFDEEYLEPKQEEKDALIDKLQSGDFTLSPTSIGQFAKSPRAFIAYKLQENKTTPAMLLGSAVHCRVLEPDIWDKQYYAAPVVDASTVAGKKVWAEIYERFTGVEVPLNKQGNPVIPKTSSIIEEIKQATKVTDENGKTIFHGVTVLPGTVNEEALFRARMLTRKGSPCRHILDQVTQTESRVEFAFAGIKFTGRVDGYGPDLICDIKNMPDAQLKPANFQIMAKRMHWQAFSYKLGMPGKRDFYILAVDGNGETSCHCFADRHLEKAEIEMQEYCNLFLECIEESFFNRAVWDMSQEFWLRGENNPHGINFL